MRANDVEPIRVKTTRYVLGMIPNLGCNFFPESHHVKPPLRPKRGQRQPLRHRTACNLRSPPVLHKSRQESNVLACERDSFSGRASV